MVEAILKERGRTLGQDTHPERGYFYRSDHFPVRQGGRAGAVDQRAAGSSRVRTPRALMKKQEEYNGKDYHQPSDQYDPSWDLAGAVDDLKVLAQLAWRIAARPRCRSTTTAISSRTHRK